MTGSTSTDREEFVGHIRMKRLPASRRWDQVVALLAKGTAPEEVAAASADAADEALRHARNDPALAHSVWLLTQILLAARAPDFVVAAAAIGLDFGKAPGLIELTVAFSDAVDRAARGRPGRTDLGEIARGVAAESLVEVVSRDLPTLFDTTGDDVRLALGKLAAPDRFARLAGDFFARLTQRHLDYYLSRTLSDHVGPGGMPATAADHSAFNAALDLHCREAADRRGLCGRLVLQGELPRRHQSGQGQGLRLRRPRQDLRRARSAGRGTCLRSQSSVVAHSHRDVRENSFAFRLSAPKPTCFYRAGPSAGGCLPYCPTSSLTSSTSRPMSIAPTVGSDAKSAFLSNHNLSELLSRARRQV